MLQYFNILVIFGVPEAFALIFIEEPSTLCVFIRIRKNNFLELPDLCELEHGVNFEKYHYFLLFNSINSTKSIDYYDYWATLGETGTELEQNHQADHTNFKLRLVPYKRMHVRE